LEYEVEGRLLRLDHDFQFKSNLTISSRSELNQPIKLQKIRKPHYKVSIISIPTLDHVSISGLGGGGEDGKGREQLEKSSTITFKPQNLSYKQFTRHYK